MMKLYVRTFPLLLALGALMAFVVGVRAYPVEASTPLSHPLDRVLLTTSGNGISNTRSFNAPGDWRIVYSFSSCQIPGFSIYVKGGDDDLFSVNGSSGRGTEYVHSGGKVYLSTNTACSWRLTVYSGAPTVNGPGYSVSGNGIANTVKLRVPSDWRVSYSFGHCEIPGFSVYVKGDVDDIFSKDGSSGRGVQYEHSSGTVYLSINTACNWSLKILK